MSERKVDLKAVNLGKLPNGDVAELTAKWVDNWSQINSRLVSLAQASFRNSVSAAEQLRTAQSPTDVVDIQMKLAKQAYDDYVGEARALSELVVKLSSEALSNCSAGLPR